MGQRLTRRELHALVWSEPMRKLAVRFGISDVALAKACRNLHVPVPPRGFWARKVAGKHAAAAALPPRPPGMDDDTMVGGGMYWRHYGSIDRTNALEPPPAEQTFDEPMDDVRNRVSAALGKVSVPKDLTAPHPVVRRLLAEDEARRAKVRESPYLAQYHPPLYDTAPRRRCLRVLSAVLQAVTSQGCRADILAADTRNTAPRNGPIEEFAVSAFRQTVRLRVAVIEVRHRSGKGTDAKATMERRVRITLDPGEGRIPDGQVWEEGERRLERQARDIAAAVMVKAEEQLRADAARSHARDIQRRAEVFRRIREEREEAERAERERLAEAERVRVERLLGEASALRKAREIRGYVEEVRAANRDAADPLPGPEMDAWADWALAQADRIDPVRNAAFRFGWRDEG